MLKSPISLKTPVTLMTTMPILSHLTGENDPASIADRLKALEADNRILLTKWSGGQKWPRADSPDATFFHTGEFGIEIVPQGRKYFEELEQRGEQEIKTPLFVTATPGEPLIFVSCGQSTPAERQLGQQIAKLVEQETGCSAYFAENQNTLEGVTENILKKLHEATGFIAIMHPRGNVSNPSSTTGHAWVRGSVWVEQEIAIAAFISQALQQPMRVSAYVHESILREGLRDKLHLNPKLFRNDSEVLEDLALILPSWRNLTPRRDLVQKQSIPETNRERQKQRKHEIRTQLAAFLKDGQKIGTGLEYSNPASLSEKTQWEQHVEQYLTDNLDQSYAIRFRNPRHEVTIYPPGINLPMRKPWAEVKARMAMLDDFISNISTELA